MVEFSYLLLVILCTEAAYLAEHGGLPPFLPLG